jgi:hypothetical protein
MSNSAWPRGPAHAPIAFERKTATTAALHDSAYAIDDLLEQYTMLRDKGITSATRIAHSVTTSLYYHGVGSTTIGGGCTGLGAAGSGVGAGAGVGGGGRGISGPGAGIVGSGGAGGWAWACPADTFTRVATNAHTRLASSAVRSRRAARCARACRVVVVGMGQPTRLCSAVTMIGASMARP